MEKEADGEDDWPAPTDGSSGQDEEGGANRRGRGRSRNDGEGGSDRSSKKGSGRREKDRSDEKGDRGRPPPPPGYHDHHAGGGEKPVIGKSSWGPIYKDENLLAGLAMILAAIDFVGLVVALVLIFIWSPMSRWLKYNLYQVIFLSVGIAIVHIIIVAVESAAGIVHLASWVFMVIMLVMTLFIGLKYLNRQEFDVPVVGDQVRKHFMQ